MKSQVKWGISLIILGLVLAPIGFPFLLIYTIPLVLIGIGILIYRRREEEIEQVKEKPS